ncbi:phage holin family protein [Anaerococcus vaginalis]|uniref:Phage holin family protein n=2 Tax=Anaerococcus obesiensis TaxID=1287640 RepID=A0A7T7ZWC4_9FIRM|nr:phage holin family protein [Anaerococcus vaginalis]MBS6920946.1 phage holin family protein [Anaerococcus vaginalis]MDU5341542.1 phage holin family protein [Anaerococcus vaginalis]MDU5989365.1 phage holin family protein [Anaerococcus vaginalis]QQN56904.1 phage holin family protein [Anaerococcus obesiensis]
MDKFKDLVKIFFTIFGSWLGFFLGDLDIFIYSLVVFVICDYISGIIRAGFERKLSSKIGFKGILKKIMIFIIVGIANICDKNLIKNQAMIRSSIIFFYIANEGLSILENALAMDLPIPKKLKILLEQFKEEK